MVAESCILTIDQGTTRQKVALFSPDGRCLGQRSQRNVEYKDASGRYQQADQWWQSVQDMTASLVADLDVHVRACAVTGRAGAAIGVNRDGTVIIDPWLDQRHAGQFARIRNACPALSTYGATLVAKLLWCTEHDINAPAHIMYAKDFLIFRLCGACVTDPSSGPDGIDWPADLIDVPSLRTDTLPRVAMPWDIVGHVTTKAARALGIPAGIPVVLGAHDGICANVGAGAISPGKFALTLGTHCVTRCITYDTPSPEAHRFYCMPPDQHVIGANAYMAGRALDWFLDQAFSDQQDRGTLFTRMDEWVATQPPGARGASFFPYLSGQISPRRRPNVRAQFQGLTDTHTRQDLYQAVLEGASFAIAESFHEVTGWLGSPDAISVTGSGANSLTWVQLIADLLDLPIDVTDAATEGRGAAIFGALALYDYKSLSDAASGMITVTRTVEPDRTRGDQYRAIFADWIDHSVALTN